MDKIIIKINTKTQIIIPQDGAKLDPTNSNLKNIFIPIKMMKSVTKNCI